MHNTWNTNRLVLFTTFLFLLLRPCLADEAAVMQEMAKLTGLSGDPCKWSGVQCVSGKVQSIDFHGKSLSGVLPPDMNQLSELQRLNVRDNNLEGALPNLSNLGNLQEVHFDSNQFSDVPMGSLSGLTRLQMFSIDNNPIVTWNLFSELKNSAQLNYFSAHNASLTGPIPDIIGSFPSLQTLKLSYNKAQGPLPASLAGSGIQKLWLNNQDPRMTGTIEFIGSMSSVQQVWLHVNQFSGPIPDLSKCEELFDLQLRDNQFTGLVPNSLGSIPSMQNISLEKNLLQGPMPNFKKIGQISLEPSNSFCSSSPDQPCDSQVTILLQIASLLGYPVRLAQSWTGNDPCKNWDGVICSSGKVTGINFASHNFSGTISPNLANLTSLKTITLKDNNLTGPIPPSLTSLPDLRSLDVSNNNLSGKVPAFGPNVVVNTAGNPFIGIDLPPPGSGKASSSGSNNGGKGLTPGAIAAIVVAIIIIIVSVGICVCRRCKKKKRLASNSYSYKRPNLSDSEVYTNNSVVIGIGGSRQMSSHSQNSNNFSGGGLQMDLLIEVTDNFSQENILGRGGFGTVYKGRLPDGTEIAVKRMVAAFMTSKGMNEFKAEIEVLSKVKHRNLVGLIGFCANGQERLLVYEFMPQGTLGEHLFEWRERGGRPLSWSQRTTIALDVARGVEYLHGMTEHSFIHRDLKPSNILLGDDMRAKVSDFGLVKNAPSAMQSIETRLAGTFGYLAPEYAATGRVTTKVDVFAFGVILMEMITGRKAVDDSAEGNGHLVFWFRSIIAGKEDIRGYIDPHIEADDPGTFESIRKVVDLAGHCTVNDPQRRPDMRHAVYVLSSLVEQWTPLASDDTMSFGIDPHMNLRDAVGQWQASEGMSSTSYS